MKERIKIMNEPINPILIEPINMVEKPLIQPFYTNLLPIPMNIEVWRNVEEFLPHVKPFYSVSSTGRVYSRLTNKILRTTTINSGYEKITLRSLDGNKIDILIHRLVMYAFKYMEGCEKLQVNHKDTIKTNNWLYNLEWMTNQQNTIHAYDNNLREKGEKNNFAILNNEQVHRICRGLEIGIPMWYICNNFLHMEYNKRMKQLLDMIVKRKNWKHISQYYKF